MLLELFIFDYWIFPCLGIFDTDAVVLNIEAPSSTTSTTRMRYALAAIFTLSLVMHTQEL